MSMANLDILLWNQNVKVWYFNSNFEIHSKNYISTEFVFDGIEYLATDSIQHSFFI